MNNKHRIAIFCEVYGKHPFGGPVIRMSNISKMLDKYNINFKIYHIQNSIHPNYSRDKLIKFPIPIENIERFNFKDYNIFWVEQGINSAKALNKIGIFPIIGSNLVPNSASQHCLPYLDNIGKGRQDYAINIEREWIRILRGKFWLSQSDFQEKEYRKLGLSWDIPVYRAPNPIDINKFYPSWTKPNEFIIGWTGKNNWAKHPYFLQLITPHFPNITFHYFSDEEADISMPSNVKMIIGNTNKEMPDLLRECSLFVSTSVTENQPLGILEAMSTGLPIVAFRTSGIPEVVEHNKVGKLVDLGNVEHFIIEIQRLLRNKEMREQFGWEGRRFIINNFSEKACMKQYLKIFDKYLED